MRRVTFICATPAEFGIDTPRSVGLGGIESTNLSLARALARRGFAVVLATRRTGTVERDGVLNVPLDAALQYPTDHVVSSNDPRPLLGARDARRFLWVHNPLSLRQALRRGYLAPLLALRPEAVFVGSLAARGMSRLFPYRRRRVIPHGVSAEFRTPAPTRGLTRDFVFASQRQRGLDRLVRLWRDAPAVAASGARLHVFGSEPADAAGRGGVVYHPRTGPDALAAFYATARGMVCPGAADETFCLAAAEAQAMGLPVVTAGIGALFERVQHGVNGLIACDDAAFAEAVAAVATDDGLWSELSAGALLQRSALTWERAATLWELAFREPASREPSGPA